MTPYEYTMIISIICFCIIMQGALVLNFKTINFGFSMFFGYSVSMFAIYATKQHISKTSMIRR